MNAPLGTIPRFVFIGKPNVGKSSLVSTLAYDEAVEISEISGTTKEWRRYSLSVAGETLYELIDTPGFQHAKRMLKILDGYRAEGLSRSEAVERFYVTYRDDPEFHDEIELLTPILEGAAVVYVVDGSQRFSAPRHGVDLQLLRYFRKAPNMCIVNLKEGVEELDPRWEEELMETFNDSVRRFDPMKDHFAQHLSILKKMAYLVEEWVAPMEKALYRLREYHLRAIAYNATAIYKTMCSIMDELHRMQSYGSKEESAEEIRRRQKEWQRRFAGHLMESFEFFADKSKGIWEKRGLECSIEYRPRLENLLDEEHWELLGLGRREAGGVVAALVVSAGVVTDLAVGGLSLGGATAAALAATGAGGTAYKYIDRLPGSRRRLRAKKDAVVREFARAWLLELITVAVRIGQHTHANRQTLKIDDVLSLTDDRIASEEWEEIDRIHRHILQGSRSYPEQERYEEIVSAIILRELGF